MENQTPVNPCKLISDREQTEYLPLCPAIIHKHVITETNGNRELTVYSYPCTEQKPLVLTLSVTCMDMRRSCVGKFTAQVACGCSTPIDCPEHTVYVHSRIESVTCGSLALWSRGEREPITLPEQEYLWQTDPLYEQIRRECDGIVTPVYRPDTLQEIWRCTCGHINLEESSHCGKCHVSHTWLEDHFDISYLESQNALFEKAIEKKPAKKVNAAKSKAERDKIKMIGILTGIGTVAILTILLFTLIFPNIRYNKAADLLLQGDFDGAIAGFTALGDYRDAKERALDATYQKAQHLTGLSSVYMTTSQKEPWYSITDDGILSFQKDEYTGSWDNFIVPDVVDGIIVRALEKNFFLNCGALTYCTLSDCIETLGDQTFFNCTSLTSVVFGRNIRCLGARTFINCTALESITIPDTVEEIGIRTFNSCTNLRSVTLGSGISEIPDYLFSCCYSLETLVIKSAVTSIGNFAFSECPSLKEIEYMGTFEQWNQVVIGTENAILDEIPIKCVQ